MSQIPIDEDAIREELRSIEGEFIAAGEGPPPGGAAGEAPGGAYEQAAPMDWTMPAGLVVMLVDRLVAPNWELEPAEKELLHTQTVQTLTAFFPTVTLDPRWVALISLGGAFAAIAGRRVDLSTGTIKPMRAPPEPADDVDQRQAA